MTRVAVVVVAEEIRAPFGVQRAVKEGKVEGILLSLRL